MRLSKAFDMKPMEIVKQKGEVKQSCLTHDFHTSKQAVIHITELVRRSGDAAPFIYESFGALDAFGINPKPQGKCFQQALSHLDADEVWTVDAFQRGHRLRETTAKLTAIAPV